MLITKGSPRGGHISPLCPSALVQTFALRDFFVRGGSGKSLATELIRYRNIDETTYSSSADENSQSLNSVGESGIHEKALVAIPDFITSNSNTTFEHVRAPEPRGGVQEWWARMLSGSINNPHSTSDCSAIGESL